jgi:tetratricopeptide (TPR) repeat protein/2-polyprenyl-3-methyl-5-hydroxy-6-metoxy-1,4-benzoquinol methylase
MNRKERRAAEKQGRNSPQSSGGGPDLRHLLEVAVRTHQAGQLPEAERLYRGILAIDPRHLTSLNHLGILALQSGRYPMAVETIGQALAVNDRVPEAHYNIAYAHYRLGRPDEAIRHYQRAIALKSDYADAHTNLGNVLRDLGRTTEAEACYRRVVALTPQSPEAHYNLGNVLAQQERLDEAIAAHRQALARNPDFVGSHNNLATALAAKGESAAAIEHYQRALALKPDLTEAHINLGLMLAGQGRLQEAIAQYGHALRIDAGHAEAHTNLANALMGLGLVDEALTHHRRALALKPDYAEMQNNLGIVLAARGEYEDAARHFENAIRLKPDLVEAYDNLGRIFLSKGLLDPALGVFRRAVAVKETQETKVLLVECLRGLPFARDSDDFRNLVLRALSEAWSRPQNLMPIAARILKQDALLKPYIDRANTAWPARLRAADLIAGDFLTLARQPLLRVMLESANISDVPLERFLTSLRCALLEAAASADMDLNQWPAIELACAIARQCFLNEYVFADTRDELGSAALQRDGVAAAIATGAEIPEFRLAIVGAYFPLSSLPGCETLLTRKWSDPLKKLLIQQVQEPAQQRQLRENIPRLTAIDDRVSLLVQEQYEENPYPRWAKAEPPGKPLLLDQYFRSKFPAASFRNLGKAGEIDMLIAGCGTGQHAIETTQRFRNERVLAIDLSLSSLSYAALKTREAGLGNIEYAQADILEIGSVERMFDIIETGGVLHHMADPFAGWRALLSRLRPNGFMAVGLYSEIARRTLEPGRAIIAERRYGASPEDIRRFRQDVMNSDVPELKQITESADFYSTSTCRDLLFHVQEHRLTLPQIEVFLQENDLQFIGFELDAVLLGRYRQKFPQDGSLSNLKFWHQFELENPNTFAGMYQFWVQKQPA